VKKIVKYRSRLFSKRILAVILIFGLVTGIIPPVGLQGLGVLVAEAAEGLSIDNGYVKATVSEKNGGYGIRTIKGDKLNKDDNNKKLLFDYDDDNTSFTSFQVTRNGETKEYIFGGVYEGSSKVKVSKADDTLVAEWSVEDLTFLQTISLINSGSNEHGTANISYTVKNAGEPAQIKCRMLMDSCLGEQDYAYYNVGDSTRLLEREVTLGVDGYSKTFYAFDAIGYPSVAAYIINASIDNKECKPYQTTFAHWNNLASTIFDYTPDYDMTFTNPYNKDYQTADSAFALYFDMGQVAKDKTSTIGTNYGIFSNESAIEKTTVTVNNIAPDVLSFVMDANGKEDQSQYENEGRFTVKTYFENVGLANYEKVKVLVYTTGGISPVNQSGEVTDSTYDNPYSIEISEFTSREKIEYDWTFYAEPKATGQYAKIHYKVYNVSADATQNTGTIMKENLLGEGYSYILCPGSVEKIPAIKFTGTTPDTVYTQGIRNLYMTGDNFSMLANKSEYKLLLKRVDGYTFNGKESIEITAENFEIDTTANKMSVLMTDETVGTLPVGMYELVFDYIDASKEDISAPALRFQVSDELKYRNDTYGFLAVIRTEDNQYYVKHFASEEAYEEETDEIAGSINRDNVLLEFRGIYIKEAAEEGSTVSVYKGISQNKNDNIMTLNDCLDIKNGTVTITEEDGSVKVDFDADLYTTGAGTSVWSGVCALTELEAGTEYALIGYDGGGERTGEEYGAETIALLWPSVGQGFQELMGLLFEFKYGEFGVIDDDESDIDGQRVIAFGAALDLSFIIPDSINCTTTTTEADNTWSMVMQQSIDYGPETIRAVNRQRKYNTDTVNTKAESHTEISMGSDFSETGTSMGEDAEAGDGDTKSASVQIDDVLFGNGYMGINMAIALGVPGYLEGMPGLQAILQINTIGDWSFGASGVCEFSTFAMEGSIYFKSKDNIPIPDEISFFIGGFVPGVCLDGFGILWLQGGGGGISNLYDTIFLNEGIPPLKLLLEVQLSLMQIISAKASLGLSLSGIEASISNGRLVNALPVLNDATVNLQWYPEFFLSGSLNVSILDAIIGSGYMVVEHDGFFEFFIRAALQIPGSIPIIGGINIADANLGANVEKIWGQVVALGNSIGVTYFWGGDIDWFSGSPVYPTYPELVGMEGGYALAAYPIGRNEETGENLYVQVGTNLIQTQSTKVGAEEEEMLSAFEEETEEKDQLSTDIDGTTHTMLLKNNGSKKILTMEWKADDLETARQQTSEISIKDNNQKSFGMILLDPSVSAEDQPNANANLTYDVENQKATLAVAFNKIADYEKVWNISTKAATSLVLYDVAPLPTLLEEATTVTVSGERVTAILKGEGLNSFTRANFIAKNKENGEETLIFYKEKAEGFAANENITFIMPENLSSGDYEVSVVLRDENAYYYAEATKEIKFTNPKQPTSPVITTVENVGDYKLAVAMSTEEQTSDAFDGYAFSAYKITTNENGEVKKEPVTGVQNVLYYKDGSKLTYQEDGSIVLPTGNALAEEFLVGGHYESSYTDEETKEIKQMIAGFQEGSYTLEVSRFKVVADKTALLYSDAASQSVTVRKPVETQITVNTVLPAGAVSKKIIVTPKGGEPYEQDFINGSEVSLVLSSQNEKFKGNWELDGGTRAGTSGEITELTQETSLHFTDLEDGTHTLEFIGKNEYGDTTAVRYRFTVDTQGPRLLLSEPANGSLFAYKTGEVTVSGITDKDAVLTIIDNDTNQTLISNKSMSIENKEDTIKIGEDGSFTTSITLDNGIVNHNLTIYVTDELGNKTEKEVLVVSDALGSIEKLLIYAGGVDITNKKVKSGTKYHLKLFAKLLGQEKTVEINNDMLVEWSVFSVAGENSIEQKRAAAVLNTSRDAEGMVTASFMVNDAGAYEVCAAFSENGEIILDMEDEMPEDVPKGGLWIAGVEEEYIYTGKAIKPAIRVYDYNTLLKEKIDYTVSYKNNKKANDGTVAKTAPTITIKGKGNYAGKVTKTFAIVQKDINDEDVLMRDIFVKYNGKAQKKTPVIKWGKTTLKNKKDYTLEYVDAVNEDGSENKDAYKLPGDYYIKVTGKGNYTGECYVTLSITEKELISKTKIIKIANQSCTGEEICPAVTVKSGRDTLRENKDYIVKYDNNKEIGTATATIIGIGNYVGEKQVTFKITGTALKGSKITGVPASVSYTGKEIKAEQFASEVVLTKKINGQEVPLIKDEDYVVSYDKNVDKGTAVMIFTGIGKCTGTVKKTFKIAAYDIEEKNIEGNGLIIIEKENSYVYTKGGVKPKPVVKFDNKILKEGTDYTLSYKNNTAVNDGSNERKLPTVIIKGKGNYTGVRKENYVITKQDISLLNIMVADKVYTKKKNAFKSAPVIMDVDGKKLKAGKDYEKDIKYTYKYDTTLENQTVRYANEPVDKNDILPIDTIVVVMVTGCGNYEAGSTLQAEYRIVQKSISGAKVHIPTQYYTGEEIKPQKDEITVKIGKTELTKDDYDIIDYNNNVKKGTATVTIKGKGNYGGIKTVKYSIKAKSMIWYWDIISKIFKL